MHAIPQYFHAYCIQDLKAFTEEVKSSSEWQKRVACDAASAQEEPKPKVEAMKLDLSSFTSIKEFVGKMRETHSHLNYLVHCDAVTFVGYGEPPRKSTHWNNSELYVSPSPDKTVDGFEKHFQVVNSSKLV